MNRKMKFKIRISVLLTVVLMMLTACGNAGNNANGKGALSISYGSLMEKKEK